MSYMLDFPSGSLPSSLDTPPYVVFGINGTDITAMLPPRIPQNLVMHFAPALRKWVLPAPKLACLPLCFACKALRTPYVGIDIRARVDAVGLRWVIKRMLHLGCVRSNTLAFSALPDLEASVAIHNAWLTLELPIEGLRNLHTHIQAQLMLGAPPASLWDMRILWNTFPQASDIVQAMGSNFVQTCTDTGYRPQESLDIQAWIQSTPELFLFFKKLKIAMPKDQVDKEALVHAAEKNEEVTCTGYQTIGKKAGKSIKAAVSAQINKQVDIMEKGRTKKISQRERHAREENDFEALKLRLRRTRSDDSLRSIDTAIWYAQSPVDDGEITNLDVVDDKLDDRNNYEGGLMGNELARSLETIRLRREARQTKKRPLRFPSREELKLANEEKRGAETISASQLELTRCQTPSSGEVNGK